MLPTRIVRRTDWTEGLTTLELDFAQDFTAGQFFNLALPHGTELIRRSYSAASAPGANLEFFVSRVALGGLTPQLFERTAGQEVLLDPKPLGFFTLDEVPACKRLWLVATGTGLGPYISMLRSGALAERFERVVFIHGVRHASQLAYGAELQLEASGRASSVYLPVVSGTTDPASYSVARRITTAWDDGALEGAAGAFDQDCHMLLCGNPKMIEDMTSRLKARGFEKHRRRQPGHFNFEKYW